MINRIAVGITALDASIKRRITAGLITQKKIDSLNKSLNMDVEEYCKFHELKSQAFIQDQITLEEAQSVYEYLGEIPDTFNNQPVAVKFVLTQLYKELLEARIKASTLEK